MLPDAAARRAIVFAGCLGMIYTQLTMSPAATEYARTLGATGWHIGLLGALPTLMIASQFVAAVVSNRLKRRRPLWMAVAIAERLLFVPAAMLAVWPGTLTDGSQLWLFIATTALNHAMLQFCAPLWLSWMGDYLPKEGLSRFWGVRHNWMQWAAAAALFGGAVWLRRSGWEFGPAFGVLLLIGSICGVIDIVTFLRIHEPPITPADDPRWRDVFAAPFRDRNFRRFILFQCYWNFAVMIGSPFISIYLLMKGGMGADRLLMLWAVSWIGGAVLSQRLGRLVETYGNKPVLSLCTMFKSANLIALLLIPADATLAFWLLVPFFMFDALLNAGMAIAQNGFLLKNSPPGNRTMFVAAGTALAGIVGGVTSIASGAAIALSDGWSMPVGVATWGPYEVAFATSIVLRIGGAWLCRYVRESEAHSTAVEVLVQLIGVTPIRVLQFPLGLYRSRFGEEKLPEPVTLPIAPVIAASPTSPSREQVRVA
jgi:MFS family permease